MAITCSICGESFWPSGRWQEDWCPDCRVNFRASDELRLRGDVEPAQVVLSPREVQALVAYRTRVRRQEEDDG